MLPAWLDSLSEFGSLFSGAAAVYAAVYARRAHREVTPNHGSSMRDLIGQMDDRIKVLGHRQGEIHDRIDNLHEDINHNLARLEKIDDQVATRLDRLENARR